MAKAPHGPLPPGSVIGILGGGQLGRMAALAAAALGYRCHIYCPEPRSPAALVSAAETCAAYDDTAALTRFAEAVDVVTFEFENVPAPTAAALAAHCLVRPSPRCLDIAQDRIKEKDFFNSIGVATAPYRAADKAGDIAAAAAAVGLPAVLKSTRLGYDGKGQVRLEKGFDPAAAWKAMGGSHGVVEGFIDFTCEVSAIVARGTDGAMQAFEPAENVHRHHILATSTVPASISDQLRQEAIALTQRTAEALDFVGLFAVEYFVTRDGRLLANEMAPRPHNSGHWTMDACVTSQFEQFIRAVAGLPLGSVERHADAVMTNLIGDDVNAWPRILAEHGAKLHLYGKTEARPGRKMGHVNRLHPIGSLSRRPAPSS